MIDDNAPQDIVRKAIVSMAYVIPSINDFPRIGYRNTLILFNPNRSLDIGEIARLCHAACFWLAEGVAGYVEAWRETGCGQKRARCPKALFSQSETDTACLMTDLG